MKTTPKALKDLFVALGGDPSAVDGLQTVDVLNAIAEKYQGEGDATRIPDAIDAITAVAGNIGGGGGGGGGTATVTLKVLNDVESYVPSINIPVVENYDVINKDVVRDATVEFPTKTTQPKTIVVPMSDGGIIVLGSALANWDTSVMPVIEGSVSFESQYLRIYGDCSIAVKCRPRDDD